MALICIVDDEPVLLNLIGTVLRLDGHEVKTFGNPLEAYEAIIAPDAAFSLLVTDVAMKPITGVQLMTRLRAKRIDFPVLLMTGHCALTDTFNKALGYRAAIDKPFTATELRKAVHRILALGIRKATHVP